MKRILVTGFDPFGGQPVNPAIEAVKRLPAVIGDWAITALEVPTVYGLAAQTVLAQTEACAPDAILCIGQAGGRSAITPEVVAINLREAAIPDNAGSLIQNEPIIPDAPAAYFATLPVREMVEAIRARGIPAALSYSAGTFVCNDLLYTLLHRYAGTEVRVGFVHIPFLPEQAGEAPRSLPSMPLAQAVDGLTAAIAVL